MNLTRAVAWLEGIQRRRHTGLVLRLLPLHNITELTAAYRVSFLAKLFQLIKNGRCDRRQIRVLF